MTTKTTTEPPAAKKKAPAKKPAKRPPRQDPLWADDVVEMDGVGAPAGPGNIDPRIEQRREEVRQEHAKGRRRVILVLLGLIGVGSAAWGITRTPLLAVQHARVSGVDQTTVDEVVHAAGLTKGTPMTDIDERGAANRLEALPWVASARVRREWPQTVLVEIRERTPSAIATARAGGWALVDGTGRVLGPVSAPDGLYPLLDGVPRAGPPGTRIPRAGRPALAVAAALGPALQGRVVLVVAREGGEVELRLRPEGSVRLGRPDRLEEKLEALRLMVARADLRRLSVLDLRVPTNPVLTRLP